MRGDPRLLLDAILMILQDSCPPVKRFRICEQSEDFDDSACERCWTRYAFAAANGEVLSGEIRTA